jgi:hypothetical protein
MKLALSSPTLPVGNSLCSSYITSLIWDLRDEEENKLVPPGDYLVTLEVAGEKHTQRARIR